MIRARRAWIVPVIGGNDEQIGRPEARQELVQPVVEALQIGGVAAHVVAVTVQRVAVHEVRENEAALDFLHLTSYLIHSLVVARGVKRACDAAAGKQIRDLSNRDHRVRRRLQSIEERLAWRRQRVVPAVRRPPEGTAGAWCADEWPGNHAPDAKPL